jgi:hypothetical protein
MNPNCEQLALRVHLHDAAICPHAVRLPHFEVRCASREHRCALHLPAGEMSNPDYS